MPWEHWVPRVTQPLRFLEDPREASIMWHALRRNFPEAVSVVIMPDHIHLLLPPSDHAITRTKLHGVTSGPSRRLKIPHLWQALNEPRHVNNRDHLRRTIRYIALNPCRPPHHLVNDPLEWPWSTYRDLMDVVADPWPGPIQAFELTDGKVSPASRHRFHDYVSRDKCVSTDGTPPIQPPFAPTPIPRHTLIDVLAATASVFRLAPAQLAKSKFARTYFVQLAITVGCTSRIQMAKVLGVSLPTLKRIVARLSVRDVVKGLAVLGDRRLYSYNVEMTLKRLKLTGGVPPLGDFDTKTAHFPTPASPPTHPQRRAE